MERYEWNEDLSIDVVAVNISKFLSRNNSNKYHHPRIFLNPCSPLICGDLRFCRWRNCHLVLQFTLPLSEMNQISKYVAGV